MVLGRSGLYATSDSAPRRRCSEAIAQVEGRRDPGRPEAFSDMQAQAIRLQTALEALFFDTSLRAASRKYLSY
jgi:hypothetical protein